MIAELSAISDVNLFIARLMAYIAAIMQIMTSMIQNIRLTPGSIIVEFDILPTPEAQQGVLKLQESIQKDEFAFEPSPGAAPLTANPESFACSGNCLAEDSSSSSLGLIIGAAVGGGVALMLVIGALVLVIRRGRGGAKNRIDRMPHEEPATFLHVNSAYAEGGSGGWALAGYW